MKRKATLLLGNLFTGRKYICRNTSWVSATDTYNFMIKDPLVDWLKLKKKGLPSSPSTPITKKANLSFGDFVKNKGNDFEQKVVDHLRTKIPVISVSTKITDETCLQTKDLMMKGEPIIHSAPFRNIQNHTKGIIDLLVRSDYLHLIAEENPLPEELRTVSAPNLSGDYHYVVIDVKFSTLPLRSDGKHLLNSGSFPAYKSQTLIYTQAIGVIQGYESRFAYILGRRWSYISRGERYYGLNCLEKLGVIDFESVDQEYTIKTIQAIDWIREVRDKGNEWSVNPPSRDELYPNMCIDSGEWNKDKKNIAENIGEITQIWYCGVKHRENALEKGVTSWKDKKCTTLNLGINGKRAKTIDNILTINRQNELKILPQKINTRIHNWTTVENEIFVDFETFTDVFASLDRFPYQDKTDSIFMIGVYKDGKYHNFTVKDTSFEEETRIMEEFIRFVYDCGNPKLWYWHAEYMIWKRACDKRSDYTSLRWANLLDVFTVEPITIKGCFKFGLKDIAKAMHEHKMIETKLESECDSGLTASLRAWQAYSTELKERHPYILDIAKYNEFDVKVLEDILKYIRTIK